MLPVGFCSAALAGATCGVTVAVNVITWPGPAVVGVAVSATVTGKRTGLRVIAFDVLVLQLPSPEYIAVMTCVTVFDKFTLGRVAAFAATVTVPNCAVPSKKVTVPVNVLVAPATGLAAAIVAVKLSGVPGVSVGGVAVSVVTVAPIAEFTDTAADVEVAYGVPSSVSVTFPVGTAVPAGGVPTVTATVTGKATPTAGVVVEGATVVVVELGWMFTVSACEFAVP